MDETNSDVLDPRKTNVDHESDYSDDSDDTDSFVDAIEQTGENVPANMRGDAENVNKSLKPDSPINESESSNEQPETENKFFDVFGSQEENVANADRFVKEALEENNSDSDTEVHQEKNDDTVIDEEYLRKQEENLTDEEKEINRDRSQEMKTTGNEQFKTGDYQDALVSYTDGLLLCPLCFKKERSILYSNRSACKMKLEKNESAIDDCTKALELNPAYLKALLRRADLYEKNDKLEDALTDYGNALKMDPSQQYAREACMRLPEQIKERNEKLKEEMMGKLKELGNMVLKPFGLSTSNFNLQQDPNTGSYNVQFQQNQGK